MIRVVDLFCGVGGSSQGAVAAGAHMAACVDSWDLALTWHGHNHDGEHILCDVAQLDPARLPAHDLLLASPPCTKHTKARGRRPGPADDEAAQLRRVGDVILAHKPALVVLENVPEFLSWPAWSDWKDHMLAGGYATYEQVLSAADHGVSQERIRLYATLTRSTVALPWALEPMARIPARDVLNPFDHPDNVWTLIGPGLRAEATIRRYLQGLKDLGDDFLLPYYKTARTGRTLERPMATVSTHPHWALVHGEMARMLTVDELRRFMGFPAGYKLPSVKAKAIHLLGNAVCPPVMTRILGAILPRL